MGCLVILVGSGCELFANRFETDVEQIAHVGNTQAGNFTDFPVAQAVRDFKPDNFLLLVR